MSDVLILKGEGLNCERETAKAFERFGGKVEILGVKSLIENPSRLLQSRILALPGGFSFGDEIQSGHILGLALTHALKEVWPEFIRRQGLAIGICNGFQTLMKMGVFEAQRSMALVSNSPHGFRNRWVHMEVMKSHCLWTRGLAGSTLTLPMRHGEGRIWSATLDAQTLIAEGRAPFVYGEDVNGSMGRIAGLTDLTGQILGLMPHPEAALDAWLVPDKSWLSQTELNATLFNNALQHIREVAHA